MITLALASIATACVTVALAYYGITSTVTLTLWLVYSVGLASMVFVERRRDTG